MHVDYILKWKIVYTNKRTARKKMYIFKHNVLFNQNVNKVYL